MTTTLIFPGKLPGNNGRGGLLRMKVKEKKQLKTSLFWTIRHLTRNQHKGPVKLELVRHSTGPPMDYDNLVSTGKLVCDQLVQAKVIPDDSPAVIVERHYSQTKAMHKDAQMTVITITDIEEKKS